MRIIQFEIPGVGRRVGIVEENRIRDLTAGREDWTHVADVFQEAIRTGQRLNSVITAAIPASHPASFSYDQLLNARPGGSEAFLCAPLDHPDPHRVSITGTGLTHTGSMQSRDQMHTDTDEAAPHGKTDSAKMFEMGLAGGKPAPGERGVAPEWFYKGNGTNLRAHNAELELPAFALDGGEEPEIVGCYIIDAEGTPRRLGFALGNEWSDHATENINYLYLAPSKLRTCAVGPELNTDCEFSEIRLRCTVTRQDETIYHSGELFSGERYMSHSLANCEDHHFKYAQHRRPGDVHLHFFGTSKLSHSTREWTYQPGDEIRIESSEFSAALVNRVSAGDASDSQPIQVVPA